VEVPVVDVGPLVTGRGDQGSVAREIDAACRETGFFSIVGHGVDPSLGARLDALAREFFALPDAEKSRIAMARGGRAWRGWFPLDGELTSGEPDHKEGVYFGAELPRDDPRVRAGVPLHGPNLFPEHPVALRPTVLAYLEALTALGHALTRGLALALGLDEQWFARELTAEPLVLFRIFRYPPTPHAGWGVGEHTDYGLLTILRQDAAGGLQVRGGAGWVDVAPDPDAFVCNLGDMLERMTRGRYRSTPHRVRNPGGRDRVSLAYFFDPAWDAEVKPVPGAAPAPPPDATDRWDGRSVHDLTGTYGDYLLDKVSKVFPALSGDVL
jgi:isopenicillin N synthase-like dioxygenase